MQAAQYLVLDSPIPQVELQLGCLTKNYSRPLDDYYFSNAIASKRAGWSRTDIDLEESMTMSFGIIETLLFPRMIPGARDRTNEFQAKSMQCQLYELMSPSAWLKDLADITEARNWMSRSTEERQDVYLLTGYRTVRNVVLRPRTKASSSVSVRDVSVADASTSDQAVKNFRIDGSERTKEEAIFAVSYQKIIMNDTSGMAHPVLENNSNWLWPQFSMDEEMETTYQRIEAHQQAESSQSALRGSNQDESTHELRMPPSETEAVATTPVTSGDSNGAKGDRAQGLGIEKQFPADLPSDSRQERIGPRYTRKEAGLGAVKSLQSIQVTQHELVVSLEPVTTIWLTQIEPWQESNEFHIPSVDIDRMVASSRTSPVQAVEHDSFVDLEPITLIPSIPINPMQESEIFLAPSAQSLAFQDAISATLADHSLSLKQRLVLTWAVHHLWLKQQLVIVLIGLVCSLAQHYWYPQSPWVPIIWVGLLHQLLRATRVWSIVRTSIRRFLVQYIAYAKVLTRPPVRSGYKRLEWRCDCGVLLYGDFDDSDPEEIKELCTLVAASVEGSGGRKDVSTSGGIAVPPQAHTNVGRSEPQGSWSEESSAPTTSATGDANLSREPSLVSIRRPRWFELCIYYGEGQKRLGEVPLEGIQSDGQLFRAIKEKYESVRGLRWKHLWLLKPVDIQFVQFCLEDRYRVSIHEKPDSWPLQEALEQGDWEYDHPSTHPPKPPPPISADAFSHHMRSNPRLHPRARYLPRMPKKLRRQMADEDAALPVGWGIFVVEGLNKSLAAWILGISTFVVFALSTFWSIWKQKGISVGSLALAVLALVGSFLTSKFFEQLDA